MYSAQGDYVCNNTNKQGNKMQSIEHFENNVFTINSKANNNICVDVSGGGKNDKNSVISWDCSGNPNQKFVYNNNNQLVDVNSGKCVDVLNQSKNNGAQVVILPCNNGNSGNNQKWDFIPQKNHLVARHSGQCMNIAGGVATGRNIVQWPCDEKSANSKWDMKLTK